MLIHPFTLPGLLYRGGDGYISFLFFRFFPSLSFRQSHSLTHSSLLLFLSLLLLLDRRSRGMSDREIASLSPSLLSPFLSPSPSPAQPIAQDRHNGIRQLGPKYPSRPTDRQTGGHGGPIERPQHSLLFLAIYSAGKEKREGVGWKDGAVRSWVISDHSCIGASTHSSLLGRKRLLNVLFIFISSIRIAKREFRRLHRMSNWKLVWSAPPPAVLEPMDCRPRPPIWPDRQTVTKPWPFLS